jgi:hypothetical protein
MYHPGRATAVASTSHAVQYVVFAKDGGSAADAETVGPSSR